ncbi:MAG: M20/M25/M40 family metallo-hydrolase [Desulfomicrobium escambiense]|nr:M20/M25/M40 family metallo-hydrolase [Desulfomicrobium escambiense]
MAHYDVVPADDEGWERPAFSGDIHDGKVWGRGSIDTKCTLVCAFEAVESLLSEGFVPKRDIYLSSGHDEEVGGNGASSIVAYLESSGVHPGLVLDEGGARGTRRLPRRCQAHWRWSASQRKAFPTWSCSCSSPGGHSSTPPRRGASARLARAILRLEGKPLPASFPEATRMMFTRLAPHARSARARSRQPVALRAIAPRGLWQAGRRAQRHLQDDDSSHHARRLQGYEHAARGGHGPWST